MQTLREILVTSYSVALPIFLGYIVWLLKEQKKARDANARGTMVILKRYLRDDHERFMDRKAVTEIERTEYEEMYKAYADLGGNGIGKVWYKDVMDLDIMRL